MFVPNAASTSHSIFLASGYAESGAKEQKKMEMTNLCGDFLMVCVCGVAVLACGSVETPLLLFGKLGCGGKIACRIHVVQWCVNVSGGCKNEVRLNLN